MNLKKQATIAALAMTVSASSLAAFQLVPNGDFESGGDSWGLEYAGGGAFSFESTGGNAGGYLQMDNTSAAWGSVAISTDEVGGSTLDVFNVTAGNTYNFQWDQQGQGVGGLGIKIESWSDTGVIGDSGDINRLNESLGWETHNANYTVDAGATRLKVVLLGIHNTVSGYDNVGITNADASAVPVPAAAWLFGSALVGLVAARRK